MRQRVQEQWLPLWANDVERYIASSQTHTGFVSNVHKEEGETSRGIQTGSTQASRSTLLAMVETLVCRYRLLGTIATEYSLRIRGQSVFSTRTKRGASAQNSVRPQFTERRADGKTFYHAASLENY
jgi:hypothetical protein